MNIDLSRLTDIELKALAYDLIAQIEEAQHKLRTANTEIARRRQARPIISEIEEEDRIRQTGQSQN